MKVFKIQTLNSPDANSRGNNPESIMQLHMYVHAQMYVFVHRQVCIHIYISMYTCACICMHVVRRYISLNPVHAKPRRILPWSLNPKHSPYIQCPHPWTLTCVQIENMNTCAYKPRCTCTYTCMHIYRHTCKPLVYIFYQNLHKYTSTYTHTSIHTRTHAHVNPTLTPKP